MFGICSAGIVRFAQHDPKSVAAVVPCDIASSTLLAATIAMAERARRLAAVLRALADYVFEHAQHMAALL